MTLQELYHQIGGSYEQAIHVMQMDKLVDKHIRKFPKNGVVEKLLEAGKSMDPVALFEGAHAMKGVCANLGLPAMAAAASEIAEEYRPGNTRHFSDAEVQEKLRKIQESYKIITDGIRQYEEG